MHDVKNILKKYNILENSDIELLVTTLDPENNDIKFNVLIHLNPYLLTGQLSFIFNYLIRKYLKAKDVKSLKHIFNASAKEMTPEIYNNVLLSPEIVKKLNDIFTQEYNDYHRIINVENFKLKKDPFVSEICQIEPAKNKVKICIDLTKWIEILALNNNIFNIDQEGWKTLILKYNNFIIIYRYYLDFIRKL